MNNDDVQRRAAGIRLAGFDVDGVLTDGSLYLNDDGQEIKAFNTLDGHGLKMLRSSGVELAIITGRRSRLVEVRAANLGIQHVYQGVENKREAYEHLLGVLGLQPDQVAYMGDDVVDLPVMRRCGLAVSVPDAPDLVKGYAHYVTQRAGGRGAVRELCELILQAQGKLDAALAPWLE
jgi:3-deoxy-D-manno-octulosonate 8-phosphate phosphatase (KDO 8-P phosphatase)